MVTWIPSIYPLYVSINIPAPWILWDMVMFMFCPFRARNIQKHPRMGMCDRLLQLAAGANYDGPPEFIMVSWVHDSSRFVEISWNALKQLIEIWINKSLNFYQVIKFQWVGLREKLQENPIFNGKIYGFRLRFSCENQSIESYVLAQDGTSDFPHFPHEVTPSHRCHRFRLQWPCPGQSSRKRNKPRLC